MESAPKRRVPIKVYALDADKMKFRYKNNAREGGNGFGLSDKECMYTLTTVDLHMVAIIYGREKGPEGREQ